MNFTRLTAVSAALLAMTAMSRAAVTQWRFDKGVDYLQVMDNTAPTIPTNWYVFVEVGLDSTNDASSVTLQGGGLSEPIPLEEYDDYWEFYNGYGTKTELDALFPAGSTCSLILSGGSLGTVTQDFTVAVDDYPAVPFLTGADSSDLLQFEVYEPLELNWSASTNPSVEVAIEIYEGDAGGDGDLIFEYYPASAESGIFMPLDLFEVGSNYHGFVYHSKPFTSGGIGGYGVVGDMAFNSEAVFLINGVNNAVGFDAFDDNLMDTNKWSLTLPPTVAVDQFDEASGRLNYLSPGTGDTFVAWSWVESELSYTQDWSIAVDVTHLISTNVFAQDEEVFFGILVTADGDLDNNISAEFINGSFGREVASYVSTGGDEVVTNTFAQVGTNNVNMKISFDADTKMLYTAYSAGGDYMIQTNYSALSWGMTASSVFNPALFAGNTETEVITGQAFADHFLIYEGKVLSNEVGLVDLEFLHSYGDGSIFLEGNWVQAEAGTSLRVISIDVLTSGGDAFNVPLDDIDGGTNYWDVDIEFPFNELWDPANDGDWTITFGFNNGTFQSTIVPFTKEDGISPMPNFYNSPFFLAPSPLNNSRVNTNIFSFGWAPAVSNANHISVEEIIGDDETGSFSLLFGDSIPGVDLDFVDAAIDGPLSTTNAGPFILGDGFRRIRINEGYARAAYNDEGIPYIVVKINEADIIFTVTADVDDDQMADDWEIQFFGSTNAVNGGPTENFDGDALNNLEEFIAGVNPADDSSVFAVEESEPAPEGHVVNWNSVAGRKYGVYWTSNLVSGFETLATDLPYPVNSYTDTVHSAEDGGFYYIDVQLQE